MTLRGGSVMTAALTMPKTGTPKIVVLEPSCTTLRGHHFQAVLDLARAVHPAKPTVVVNAKMQSSLSFGDLTFHRLFQRGIYEPIYQAVLGERPQQPIQRRWWQFKRSVLRMQQRSGLLQRPQAIWPEIPAVAERVSLLSADHIVLPTANIDLILELVAYLRNHGGSQPQVHARILAFKGGRQGLKELDRLFEKLSSGAEPGDRVHLYVEMPAMQRFLSERYAVPVDLYPYLLNDPAKDRGRGGRSGKKPVTFGYLGYARAEKGFDRLLPIISAVCANGSFEPHRVAFLVQLDGPAKRVDPVRSGLKRLASEHGVEIQLVEGVLSPETYSELLEQINCVLLPYRNRYRFSGSGVLFEALLNAKPFICSSGLSFADYARAGNGIEASDDQAFAEAILKVAGTFELFGKAAQRAEDNYRASLAQMPLLQRLRTSRLAPAMVCPAA